LPSGVRANATGETPVARALPTWLTLPLLELILNARTCWSPSVAIQTKPVPVAPPLLEETQLNMAPIEIAATSKPIADFIRIRTPDEKV